ncbi:hypothetical protein GQ457_12G000800 [Hibiscus cannabinus]
MLIPHWEEICLEKHTHPTLEVICLDKHWQYPTLGKDVIELESNTAIVHSELWVYKVFGATVLAFGGQSPTQRLHTSGEYVSKAVASIPRHGLDIVGKMDVHHALLCHLHNS